MSSARPWSIISDTSQLLPLLDMIHSSKWSSLEGFQDMGNPLCERVKMTIRGYWWGDVWSCFKPSSLHTGSIIWKIQTAVTRNPLISCTHKCLWNEGDWKIEKGCWSTFWIQWRRPFAFHCPVIHHIVGDVSVPAFDVGKVHRYLKYMTIGKGVFWANRENLQGKYRA